jgi:sialidase-1
MNRRQFLCRATAAVLLPVADGVIAQGASTASTVVSRGAQRSLLKRKHEQIVCQWSAPHPRHDHQLIFPLDARRLMLVWCEYYANRPSVLDRTPTTKTNQAGDDMPCRISARISSDAGRTWSDTFTLQENRWRLNVKHPNLVRVSEQELVFTFVGWDSAAQRNVFCRRSKNNGETWSESVQISEPGHYCNNADRALRLSTGRIVLPAHGTFSEKYIGAAPYGRGSKLHSFAFCSDDGGETWNRSANSMTAPGRGAHEPTVAELKDGRLLCFLRTTNQRIYRSYSADGGMHWSEPQPTDLPSPESPSLLKRIPATGDLLLLWNNVASKSNWPRTPLTAAISRDEGETWSIVGDIDNRPDHDAAYASAAFVNDEALVAYYTRPTSWARDCEIMLTVFDLAVFTH